MFYSEDVRVVVTSIRSRGNRKFAITIPHSEVSKEIIYFFGYKGDELISLRKRVGDGNDEVLLEIPSILIPLVNLAKQAKKQGIILQVAT